ncbi:alpha/beta fold hydrolase [Leucobacter aridicollis]|uniref:Pimeloyl-ACP methyl ester carboxylesterase n=1 Tax=Leucobacter aridicollis TaxID=283878 RepID=A0A852RFZ9_9MICO|nr:alpha/beta hydrolase [Leucobacter aridicollis]MBL3683671.1 alpha/beta hydrolase [Leucobacter aridicollis]NYD28276.1 pimeloyl-ACP methyl ester carboxylesterase [Leucobacter aridicollis]
MRKPLKITLTLIGAIVAIPALALGTTAIVNAVATKSELQAIEPYGELVPVAGRHMNVVDTGSGDETVVLLPGLGTAAPALDFQPLITELRATHRVIAVEPFGTGLSDQTDTPRTAANIAEEVHEALQQLDVDRYVLMGHSIAGIYALEYSARYPAELVAFVGIDSSVPGQPGSADEVPTDGLATLNRLGILRVLSALSGDLYTGTPFDDETKQQMSLLSTRNATAPTILDEMKRAPENFTALRNAAFPAALPVLLFVATDDTDVPGWIELHDRQAETVDHGETRLFTGGHYLHHTQSSAIAAETTAFLAALPAG